MDGGGLEGHDEDLPFTRKHKEDAIKGTVRSYIRPKNNTEDELIEKVIIIDVEYEDGKEILTITFSDGMKERLTENQLHERSQPDGWYDIKDLRDGEVRMMSHDLSQAEAKAATNDGKDHKLKTMMIKVKWKGYTRMTWGPADALKEYVPDM
ncbi:hypothetical protein TrRE_jg12373 [Triparma retinervis]|uniref:Uncharacterized protein n=1 Tax=Triparma retinervis TaxID=2557542 RepID=A0A9W7E024_9STRA|nr:hypothetical protein TrRE_jg12373 [Triparma retinervis]